MAYGYHRPHVQFRREDERGVTESRGEERRLRCVREGDYSVVERTRSEEIFAVGFAVMRDRPCAG